MCSTTSPLGEGVCKEGLASLDPFVLKTDLEVGVTIDCGFKAESL
jgi:hypothetical protein